MRKKLRNAAPCKKRAISLLARYTFSHFDSPVTASVHYKLLHKTEPEDYLDATVWLDMNKVFF